MDRLIPECSGGGARSKLRRSEHNYRASDTRMLRGERDQNRADRLGNDGIVIPECSGGSEIKTSGRRGRSSNGRYQNAPGGARSKPGRRREDAPAGDTRMLRGERDQNPDLVRAGALTPIPECCGGSENKTGGG